MSVAAAEVIQTEDASGAASPFAGTAGISFLDVLAIVYPYRLMTLLAAAVLALAVAGYRGLVMPDIWHYSGMLVPHIAGDPTAGWDFASGSRTSTTSEEFRERSEVVFSLADDVAVKQRIVEKLELRKHYGSDTMEQAVRQLDSELSVSANPRRSLVITYSVDTPLGRDMAVAIAEQYRLELSDMVRKVNADVLRNAIEGPGKLKKDLESRLDAQSRELEGFRADHHIIAVEEDTKYAAKARAELDTKITDLRAEVAGNGRKPGHGPSRLKDYEIRILEQERDRILDKRWDHLQVLVTTMESQIADWRRQITQIEEAINATMIRMQSQALVLAEVSKPQPPERPQSRRVGRWTVATFVGAWFGQQVLIVVWFIARWRMGGGAIRRRAVQIWNRPAAA